MFLLEIASVTVNDPKLAVNQITIEELIRQSHWK